MASSGTKQYGITGPISEALPTAEENRKTDELLEELKKQNNFESAADTTKRYALRTLISYCRIRFQALFKCKLLVLLPVH